MKYLLWILGLFAVAAALTVASHNPGYVMLVYPPYRVELSLTLFIVLSLLGFVIGYGLVRMILAAVKLPAYVQKYRLERSQARARSRLDEVLSAYFEGRYAEAEKAAANAIEAGETSALHPIIAARSAHELQDFKKRDAYLSTAAGKKIGDSTMRLMATTKFMLDQHDPRAALDALHELRDSGIKGHLGAMSLELKAQQQAGNWDAVLKLLDQLEKRGSIDAKSAEMMRLQAWQEMVRQQTDLAGLTACLKNIPGEIKKTAKFAATAARALIVHNGYSLALQIITDSLNGQWDSDLVALYGSCQGDDVVAQIEQAEKWLNSHRQDAGLLLALGKLCLHQKLWGKARSYLDASISLVPSSDAYTALGQLAERLGQADEAARYYQSAIKL